jgi:hypothetical protein
MIMRDEKNEDWEMGKLKMRDEYGTSETLLGFLK